MLATRSAREIHDVIMSLREFSTPDVTPARRMREVRVMSRAFAESVSDAVVRVRVLDTQHPNGAFFTELLDLLHIQIQSVMRGVFIRAGVAIGNVGMNGNGSVFGAAMVRAYEVKAVNG